MKAKTVTDVVMGEAGGKTAAQRYNDMKHIASVMVNRALATGTTIADVALSRSQFNAYGKKLPAGVEKYRNLAEKAIDDVLTNGPVTDATYYATPAAKKNLPKGLDPETKTASHEYFSDPHGRAIVTRQGAMPVSYQPTSIQNVPTPTFADRAGTGINQADSATGIMSALNPATPMSVTRGGLLSTPKAAAVTPQQGYGLLASTMSQTPVRNLSGAQPTTVDPGRFSGGMVAQGPDQLRSGLLSTGSIPSRAAQMAEMQAQANFQNEVNQARQRVSAYTPEKAVSTAAQAIDRASPLSTVSTAPTTATPTASTLANAHGQLANTMGEAGVLGLSGQKVLDPSDILGVGKLAPAPGALPVENMPVTTAYTEVPAVEGPIQSAVVNAQPQAVARQSQQQGLLSDAEYGMVRDQQQRLAAMGVNRKEQLSNAMKKGVGAFGGGILGGLLAGPIGAVVGGLLGNQIVNPSTVTMRGTGLNAFPSAPKGPSYGDGKPTSYGNSVAQSSGQYGSARSKGSVGLY